MRAKEKPGPDGPARSTSSLKGYDLSIAHDNPDRTSLTLVFRVDQPEEAEALHTFRAAFAGATDLEALDERTFVLHIRPGICGCGDVA